MLATRRAPDAGARRCPVCLGPVPESVSASGRRPRGRPRTFCSSRCRLGDPAVPPVLDPERRRAEARAFAAGVRAAIAERGLPLRELERELVAGYGPLASSVATLSAWQSGSSTPPPTRSGRDRVLALERALHVPTGDLVLLMPGGGTLPPPRPSRGADGGTARRSRLQQVLAALGGPQQVLQLELEIDHRLGRDRNPLVTRTRMRVRAVHAGVDRFWYVRAQEPGRPARVHGLHGCRVEREVVEPARDPLARVLVATELCFGRPLARGDHHGFAFAVDHGVERPEGGWSTPPPAERVFRHVQLQPCERLDLTVSFDRAATPAQIAQVRWRARDLAEVARTTKTRRSCWQYRLVVDDPPPSGYGWRWRWAAELRFSAA